MSLKSVQWEPSCSMQASGRTNKHDEADSCLTQFCERVKKTLDKQILSCESKHYRLSQLATPTYGSGLPNRGRTWVNTWRYPFPLQTLEEIYHRMNSVVPTAGWIAYRHRLATRLWCLACNLTQLFSMVTLSLRSQSTCKDGKCKGQLTLSLLMSYIYGVPCKARNFNVVYTWTYVWQRCKSSLSICCTMFQH
jgi:hypothetical protein